jgi:hypothetical protein
MPLIVKCPDHPTAVVDYPTDIFEHCRDEHPGERPQDVADRLERTFISQAHALGNPEMRIIGCRSCGRTFEVRTPPGDTSKSPTLCEECRA